MQYTIVPSNSCMEALVLESPVPGFYGVKAFSQKIEVVTIWIIIHLEILFKGIDTWADWKGSLKFRLNNSMLSTCLFSDAQLKKIPRSAIYDRNGPNSLSACIRLTLKPSCRYSFLTCFIPSSMLFTFRFLIIFPVANKMCRGMLFRKLVLLMNP